MMIDKINNQNISIDNNISDYESENTSADPNTDTLKEKLLNIITKNTNLINHINKKCYLKDTCHHNKQPLQ